MTTSSPISGRNRVVSRAMRMLDEHVAISRALDDLLNRAESGEWSLCDSVWDRVSREIEEHMRFEEIELLPDLAASSAEAEALASRIRDEHDAVRAALITLGIAVQLHTLRAEQVHTLVELLRAHAECENRTLYPWAVATQNLRPATQDVHGAQIEEN